MGAKKGPSGTSFVDRAKKYFTGSKYDPLTGKGQSKIGRIEDLLKGEGIPQLFGRDPKYDPTSGKGQSAIGRIEDMIKGGIFGDDPNYDPKTGKGQSRIGRIEDLLKGRGESEIGRAHV